jgi:hypothetical protein
MIKVTIEPHSGADKSFRIDLPHEVSIFVDYDDVDHPAVDAVVEVLKKIVEENWDDG